MEIILDINSFAVKGHSDSCRLTVENQIGFLDLAVMDFYLTRVSAMAAPSETLHTMKEMGFLEEVRSKSAILLGSYSCFSGPSKISAVRGLEHDDWD